LNEGRAKDAYDASHSKSWIEYNIIAETGVNGVYLTGKYLLEHYVTTLGREVEV
jgi:hypothetical protein